MVWGMRVLGQHWVNHLVLYFLNTLMAPYTWLVMLLRALWEGSARSPYSSWIDEQWWETACGGTLLHMMPQGHSRWGPWWAKMVVMMGNSRWWWLYVVVHDMSGLIVGSLCRGLVVGVQGRAGLLWCYVQDIGLMWASWMHGQVLVGWWQLLCVLHIGMLCGL